MNDFLSRFAFGIGLFLIVFHSLIFHFIKWVEKPIQKPSHASIQYPIRQSQNAIKQNHIPPSKVYKASQIMSDKVQTYKITKSQKPLEDQQKYESSDDYIETVLNKQKKFFETCYIRHLKNNLAFKGSIMLSFNINSPGKISNVSIQGGSAKNATLHKCMKAVAERMTFRHFSGPATTVLYPIEFY